MEKELPVRFNIELKGDGGRIYVETSVRLANMSTESINNVPGVNKFDASFIYNYMFGVDISKMFNPERVALSLARAVIDTAIDTKQLDRDTAISIEYNKAWKDFDNVDALDTAIDAMPERSEREPIVPKKYQSIKPESEPIPDSV